MNYGLKMPSGTGGQGLRMPTAPSTIPGQANLRAPAGALTPSSAAGANPMQMMQLMQMLSGPQQQQAAPPMDMMMGSSQPSQEAMDFIAQYGPAGQMQMQRANDEMMQQRMQGLLALLGGQ